MSISSVFQARVLELVEDSEFSKSEIPAKMGIAPGTFSKVINYGIIPKVKILIRMADLFNISVEYLLGMTDEDYFVKSDGVQTFQERLEKLRQEIGISYGALSNKIHIGRNYFNAWRTNNYYPSLEILILLADFFKVSLDYLLGRTDDR